GIREQVAELAVLLRADRTVERDRRLGDVERLVDVLQREPRLRRELLARRLPPELELEPVPGAPELAPALVDVRRDANRVRLPGDGALAGLPDPPGGVGRELVAAPPVELLDRPVQPDHALLEEVEQGH